MMKDLSKKCEALWLEYEKTKEPIILGILNDYEQVRAMTPDSQKRASQTYRDKMLSNGFVACNVWVPFDQKEVIKEMAKKLRDE